MKVPRLIDDVRSASLISYDTEEESGMHAESNLTTVIKRTGGLEMQRKKYTEEQSIQALKEGEAGAPVAELCRKYGMNDASCYTLYTKSIAPTRCDNDSHFSGNTTESRNLEHWLSIVTRTGVSLRLLIKKSKAYIPHLSNTVLTLIFSSEAIT
jgi:hypothetical protein